MHYATAAVPSTTTTPNFKPTTVFEHLNVAQEIDGLNLPLKASGTKRVGSVDKTSDQVDRSVGRCVNKKWSQSEAIFVAWKNGKGGWYPECRLQPMWPDLAKFRHFGKISKVFGQFLDGLFSICQTSVQL